MNRTRSIARAALIITAALTAIGLLINGGDRLGYKACVGPDRVTWIDCPPVGAR